jgi:hypothetical protein
LQLGQAFGLDRELVLGRASGGAMTFSQYMAGQAEADAATT